MFIILAAAFLCIIEIHDLIFTIINLIEYSRGTLQIFACPMNIASATINGTISIN